MLIFFETYRSQIIYGVGVITAMILIRYLTKLMHLWIIKRKIKKYPNETSHATIDLIIRILNALWLVLGIIALSFLIIHKENYVALQKDFKLIMYLGFVAVLTIVLATSTNLWFKTKIRHKILKKDDPTSFKFLRYVVVSLIIFIGGVFGLLVFPSLRGVAQTALGGVGILTLILGVASQEALSNLVGGLFIIAFKPFKIGDIIKITDSMIGRVSDITLRHTVIRNFENKMIVIPNAVINKEKLINYDLGEHKCCERIEIGISYASNVALAKKIMREECEKHPLILDNRTAKEKKEGLPIIRTALTALNDSSVTIRAWAWARNHDDTFTIRYDILESVKERFENEGIEIPFPYRTIVMKQEVEEAKNETAL